MYLSCIRVYLTRICSLARIDHVSTMYRSCIAAGAWRRQHGASKFWLATTATSATPVSPLSSRPTMGADSHRRFYRGRPQPREVPYTPATPTAVLPRSQKRNQQRQRQPNRYRVPYQVLVSFKILSTRKIVRFRLSNPTVTLGDEGKRTKLF